MKKQLYLSLIVTFFSASVTAQYNLGVATGNYSGLNPLYLNPANIADSREKIVIEVGAVGADFDNNLGSIKTSGGAFGLIHEQNLNSVFSYYGNNTFSMIAPYAQIHLPGIMVAINHKHSVALTAGFRGFSQFNNFDRSLYRTITDTAFVPTGNRDLTSRNFNYTEHAWSEINLSYAGVVLDQGEHEIRLGATLKFLGGIGYIGLKGNNLDAHYKTGNDDSLFVNNSDLEFASNILSTRSAVLNGLSSGNVMDELFGKKDGHGIGADLGIVYDYMPNFDIDENRDNARNRYKLRVSASVVDIGAINYSASVNSNAIITGNGVISAADISKNVSTFEDFRHYAVSHGFTADTSHRATKVYLPTTLHLSADYKVYRHMYVNATFIANLANRDNFGNSFYNQLTVTPRYDTRFLSVGMPITYSTLNDNIKVGVGVRVSGFYIGSDDVMGLFVSHQSSANFYIGGFVPFYWHHHAHHSEWDGNQLHDNRGKNEPIEIEDSTGNDVSFSGNIYEQERRPANSTAVNGATLTGHTAADNRNYKHEEMEEEQH
jgi:hypothetical protein